MASFGFCKSAGFNLGNLTSLAKKVSLKPPPLLYAAVIPSSNSLFINASKLLSYNTFDCKCLFLPLPIKLPP